MKLYVVFFFFFNLLLYHFYIGKYKIFSRNEKNYDDNRQRDVVGSFYEIGYGFFFLFFSVSQCEQLSLACFLLVFLKHTRLHMCVKNENHYTTKAIPMNLSANSNVFIYPAAQAYTVCIFSHLLFFLFLVRLL